MKKFSNFRFLVQVFSVMIVILTIIILIIRKTIGSISEFPEVVEEISTVNENWQFVIVSLICITFVTLCIPLIILRILDFLERKKERCSKHKEINPNIILANIENRSSKNAKVLPTSYELKQDTLLELSEKRKVDKSFKDLSFKLAIIMSVLGVTVLFAGIVASFIFGTKLGWLTTYAGAIVEVVAGLFFWLVNKTMKEVKENSILLENTKNQITAMELVEKIVDQELRDITYTEIVKGLIKKDTDII